MAASSLTSAAAISSEIGPRPLYNSETIHHSIDPQRRHTTTNIPPHQWSTGSSPLREKSICNTMPRLQSVCRTTEAPVTRNLTAHDVAQLLRPVALQSPLAFQRGELSHPNTLKWNQRILPHNAPITDIDGEDQQDNTPNTLSSTQELLVNNATSANEHEQNIYHLNQQATISRNQLLVENLRHSDAPSECGLGGLSNQ